MESTFFLAKLVARLLIAVALLSASGPKSQDEIRGHTAVTVCGTSATLPVATRNPFSLALSKKELGSKSVPAGGDGPLAILVEGSSPSDRQRIKTAATKSFRIFLPGIAAPIYWARGPPQAAFIQFLFSLN